jgi:Tol biopolymer transport system component
METLRARTRLVLLLAVAAATATLPGAAPASALERVSGAPGGAAGNGFSDDAAISGDGRFVAFASSSSNLVAGDANGAPDVFVRDRRTGTTERVDVATGGAELPFGASQPTISGDGRMVGFATGAGVYVHDRRTGATWLAGPGGTAPALSADGRTVAYTAFVADPPAAQGVHVFVSDRQGSLIERVDVGGPGSVLEAPGGSAASPSISADGRRVAFAATSAGSADAATAYVRDRRAGTTTAFGPMAPTYNATALSPGGGVGAFTQAGAAGLDVDLVALVTGARVTVSRAADPFPASLSEPDLDGDGRLLAYESAPSRGPSEIRLHDRLSGADRVVSLDASGTRLDGANQRPAISVDGRMIAFDSSSANKASGISDVYVVDPAADLAVSQIKALLTTVAGLPLEPSFRGELAAPLFRAAVAAGTDPAAAVRQLRSFEQVAQRARGKELTNAQASALRSASEAIRRTLKQA